MLWAGEEARTPKHSRTSCSGWGGDGGARPPSSGFVTELEFALGLPGTPAWKRERKGPFQRRDHGEAGRMDSGTALRGCSSESASQLSVFSSRAIRSSLRAARPSATTRVPAVPAERLRVGQRRAAAGGRPKGSCGAAGWRISGLRWGWRPETCF